MRPKYKNVTFYCHNLGGYDVVFIIKVLYDFNDRDKEDPYNISCFFKDDKIIQMKINKNNNSVTIKDSYTIFNSSLAKSFGLHTVKSVSPHGFSSRNHLFYIGNTPDIYFYGNISAELYKEFYTTE